MGKKHSQCFFFGRGEGFPGFRQGEGTTKSRSYDTAVRRRNLQINTHSPLAKHSIPRPSYVSLSWLVDVLNFQNCVIISQKTIMFSFYVRNKAISNFLIQNEVWGYDCFCLVGDWIL